MNGLVAWWDDPDAGPENMAADELLASEAAETGRLVVRIYGWSRPTVSLGGFQRLADARTCAAIADLPLVRRPSGGGAIVHGGDLTYAAAVPRGHPWGNDPQPLYDAFHAALETVLRDRGVAATRHPGRDRDAGDESRLLCFDRRARGDLVVAASDAGADGHKVLGSAQRRLQAAVLQHGSLLLASPASVPPAARHAGLVDLATAARDWDLRELATVWLREVAAHAGGGLEVRPEGFAGQRKQAVADRASRFRDPDWLARR